MEKLKILHMYPNMLDLYGDSGNVEVLSYRCKMRGIELDVSKHLIGDKETDFTQYDIIYLGGGADFEQQILADDLVSCKDSIMEAYKAGTFFLMICGGYQLMGQYYKDSTARKCLDWGFLITILWRLPIKDADVSVISSSRLSLTEKNTRS